MQNEKLDRRKRYTKMVIEKSFFELYKEKSIDRITVKEICDKAYINRSTFYSHYIDKFDILEKVKEDLYHQFKEIIVDKAQQILLIAKNVIYLIYKNKDICETLFSNYRDMEFMKKIVNLGIDSLDKWRISNAPLDIDVYTFISAGTVGLIVKWIDNGMTESIDELIRKIDILTRDILEKFAIKF